MQSSSPLLFVTGTGIPCFPYLPSLPPSTMATYCFDGSIGSSVGWCSYRIGMVDRICGNGIVVAISFCSRLFSLTTGFLNPIPAAVCTSSLQFPLPTQPSTVCICQTSPVHSPIHGWAPTLPSIPPTYAQPSEQLVLSAVVPGKCLWPNLWQLPGPKGCTCGVYSASHPLPPRAASATTPAGPCRRCSHLCPHANSWLNQLCIFPSLIGIKWYLVLIFLCVITNDFDFPLSCLLAFGFPLSIVHIFCQLFHWGG